jgi:hypothetical protein
VDEFQTFSSDAFASLLSEARKFAMHFCLANQYADQLQAAVRSTVIGNAGTLAVFRVGSRLVRLRFGEVIGCTSELRSGTYVTRQAS